MQGTEFNPTINQPIVTHPEDDQEIVPVIGHGNGMMQLMQGYVSILQQQQVEINQLKRGLEAESVQINQLKRGLEAERVNVRNNERALDEIRANIEKQKYFRSVENKTASIDKALLIGLSVVTIASGGLALPATTLAYGISRLAASHSKENNEARLKAYEEEYLRQHPNGSKLEAFNYATRKNVEYNREHLSDDTPNEPCVDT